MAGRDDFYKPDFVKIPFDVFMLLCRAHLTEGITPSEMLEIKLYLSDKMRRVHNHYSYVPRAKKPPVSENPQEIDKKPPVSDD